MIELYNALKFITMLFCIRKILTFNLGVAFLKSVSILNVLIVMMVTISGRLENVRKSRKSQ